MSPMVILAGPIIREFNNVGLCEIVHLRPTPKFISHNAIKLFLVNFCLQNLKNIDVMFSNESAHTPMLKGLVKPLIFHEAIFILMKDGHCPSLDQLVSTTFFLRLITFVKPPSASGIA